MEEFKGLELGKKIQFGDFTTIKTQESKDKVVYRVSIKNEEDANEWKEDFERISRTQWVVYQNYPNPERLQYHKKYACGLSNKNKDAPEGKSKRNFNCPVKMHIRIKIMTKNTIRKDQYLQLEPPLPGEVEILQKHNHNLDCSTVLKFNRPKSSLRTTFETYFDTMCPGSAIRFHESCLLSMENGYELLADGHHNPHAKTVYWWHSVWRTANLGPLNDPLPTLEQKIDLYKEKGVIVVVRQANPWVVLVSTPIMIRAQQLSASQKIIFVDTSASCDSTSCNVTVMLTATKAGAVPLAVLLHEAQTQESYEVAFSLFKETFPSGFGGADHPTVFMTDNSAPEKNALKNVWPGSIQLLCGFHVGQAEWRWLHENAANEFRRDLMKAFQNIQYAPSAEKLEEAIDYVKEVAEDYYSIRVSKLLENKKEWVQLFRTELPIGGHNTNNFAEASIRVLKDVILERTKAFNAAALVDYVAGPWENYLTTRLCRFAYDRNASPLLLYEDLLKRIDLELAEKIEVIDDDTYLVPSAQTNEPSYEVIVSSGSCLCKFADGGTFCKHLALVHYKFGRIFPNQPLINSADRYLLGKLAMGDKCPKKEFFLKPKESMNDFERDLLELEQYEQTMGADEPASTDYGADQVIERRDSPDLCDLPENDDSEDVIKKFAEAWEDVTKLGTESNRKNFLALVSRATRGLKKITTHNKAYEGMMRVCAALKLNTARSGKKMKVQPTAIARRRPGITKGCGRVPSGRPAKGTAPKNKRPRKLAKSVDANKPHYKKH